MISILPQAQYCSYASPLIMQAAQTDIPLTQSAQCVVLNSFPAADFIEPTAIDTKPLQLLWFSQNIDFKRGLEPFIDAVDLLSPQIELHLGKKLTHRVQVNKIFLTLYYIFN